MNKYRNTKVQRDGIVFDSKAEAARYSDLALMMRAGRISGLRVHPRYELQPAFRQGQTAHKAISYIGDFAYQENGVEVVEDVKGRATEVFRIKEKLFRYRYPNIDLRILKV